MFVQAKERISNHVADARGRAGVYAETRAVKDSEVIQRIESSLISPNDGPFGRFFKRIFSRILFGSMRLGSYVAMKSFFYRKPEEDEKAQLAARGLVSLFV